MRRTIEIEELLNHSGWLRRLAASLVGDAQAADDLVQETWLAALRRPPEARGAVRPWLARVVRNLATNRRRDERRRREHEGASGSERPAPSPDALLQDAEMQRHLAEAVTKLAEPLRSVVVLRYLHGLDSAAIARELGLPASTVRSRLAKALEELRAELDRRWAGGREAWSVALLELVRRGEGHGGPALATRTSAGPAHAGVRWLAAGCGAVLLAFLGTILWKATKELWGERGVPRVIASEPHLPAPIAPPVFVADFSEPARVPLAASGVEWAPHVEETAALVLARQDTTPPEIRGRALGPLDLRPLPGAAFSSWLVLHEEGQVHAESFARGTCDAEGRFHFQPGSSGFVRGALLLEAPGAWRLLPLEALPPGRGLDLGDIVLEETRAVRMHLLEPSGAGIANGCLALDVPGDLAKVVSANADGEANLSIPLSGARVLCFAQRFAERELDVAPDDALEVTLEPVSSLDVVFVHRGEPQGLSALVTSAAELFAPVPEIEGRLLFQQGSSWSAQAGPGAMRYSLQPGEDLRLYGLRPGVSCRIEIQDLEGRTLATRTATVAAKEWQRLEIPLD